MGSTVRIGITGSHGTGKTTLAVALAEQTRLPLIQEQAREVARALGIHNIRDLKSDYELGRCFQWGCLDYQLDAEKVFQNGFVSDRTTIDNAAYWFKDHAHIWPSELSSTYCQRAMDNVKNYDLIIYFPPELKPEDDGFRTIDRRHQLEIDWYIQAFLKLTAPNFVTVRGVLEERVGSILVEMQRLRE